MSAALPSTRPLSGMATGELLCWAVAFFATVSLGYTAAVWLSGAQSVAGAFNAIELIAWGCALRLIGRDPDRLHPASGRQIAVLAVISFAALLAPGRLAALALIPLGGLLLTARGWSTEQRRAGAIFLAIGGQRLLGNLVPILFGDVILRLDTAAAGLMMQAFVPGTSWTGTTLKPPGEVGVSVMMACSSFANLSFVMLCFVSLYAVDGGRNTRRAIAAVAGIGVCVVVLNTVRLVATARSLESYLYWHDGVGAQIFGVLMTLMTVGLCSQGSRWASQCR